MNRRLIGFAIGVAAALCASSHARAVELGALMGGYGGSSGIVPSSGTVPNAQMLMMLGGGPALGVVGGSQPLPGGGAMVGMLGAGGAGGMIGMCGLGGGCCGGMISGFPCYPYYYGAFLGFPQTQTYSNWSASPNKSYYYRTVQVHAPVPNDLTFDFVLVYRPDQPKFFFFYDSLEKKYLGRYILGARQENCFSLLNPMARKRNLNEIPSSAFRTPAAMPSLADFVQPRFGFVIDTKALQNVRLHRPPETIPDELLGLPPEEEMKKKSKGQSGK